MIGGLYPMLYAFFDASLALRRDAHHRQIEAAIACDVAGIAVLGLGTEVAKLGLDEKKLLINWTLADVKDRVPVAVTIAEHNLPDMIAMARFAEGAGANWLILQPPRPPASSADLIEFFGRVADAVSLPIGIQNAPEFLGIGLSPDDLLTLNHLHPNIKIVKAECSAVTAAETIQKLKGRMQVFNGRAGLELTDNLRAGCAGMIPGIETIDFQNRIFESMKRGDDNDAEQLYAEILPALVFIMQGLGPFILYGKYIAALRLGLEPSAHRFPSDRPTDAGLAWAKRFAQSLGPLP